MTGGGIGKRRELILDLDLLKLSPSLNPIGHSSNSKSQFNWIPKIPLDNMGDFSEMMFKARYRLENGWWDP